MIILLLADVILLVIFGVQKKPHDTMYQHTMADMSVSGERSNEVKKIALTFDDGPNKTYTLPLLEGLEERGVKATFFLLGQQVTERPDIAEKIVKDGHMIGNHSFYHDDLREMDREEALLQVSRAGEVIYEATGKYPQVIRPPFGHVPENLVYEPPMAEVLWTIDSRDWELSDVGTIIQNVVPNAEENAIILMHDSSQSSVDAALAIVDELKQDGYTFVTLDEILFD